MKKRCGILMLTTVLLLCGCHIQSAPASPPPVVTQIEVVEEKTAFFSRRYYNTTDKLQRIMLAIRALQPRFAAVGEPELLTEPVLRLTVVRSDGVVRQYRMKGLRYWQEEDGSWKKVKSEAAAELWRTLWSMPSDPEQARKFWQERLCLPESWIHLRGRRKLGHLWRKQLADKNFDFFEKKT